MAGPVNAPNDNEIRSALRKAGLTSIDKNILKMCVKLASNLELSADFMANCWEAFSLNKQVKEMSNHTFQAYRSQVIKESEQQPVASATTKVEGLGKRQTKDGLHLVTPPAKRHSGGTARSGSSAVDSVVQGVGSPSRSTALPMSLPKYDERKGVDQVVASFKPDGLPDSSDKETSNKASKCVLSYSFPTNVEKPYRYMFTTLQQRAKALDDHLAQFAEEIIQVGGNGDNALAPLEAVNVPRQDVVCSIGRICNEAHEGKLNSTSVVLEGDCITCGGARINVDLSHLQSSKTQYSLFPGQVVAIEGINNTGRKLVAHRIIEGASHKPNTSSVKELRGFHHDLQSGSSVKIVTACGPYTTSDNLDYEPLLDFMELVLEQEPDVVILMGPFVDMRHQSVKKGDTRVPLDKGGDMAVSYEALFANKISMMIDAVYDQKEDLHTQFVIVPSLEDATAQWVYPQPPFQDRSSNGRNLDHIDGGDGIEIETLGLSNIQSGGRPLSKRIHCLPNPCTLKVNEVVIGLTSTDTLFHISAEETNANLEPGSRLRRISEHLLQQRSYYPVFPPPNSFPTNLDLKLQEKWQMPCQPDVLILPSRLKSFANTVQDGTIVVNPGHLSRGTTGGTYGVMEIHPLKENVLDAAGGDGIHIPHGLYKRTHVEIKRI